MTRETADSPKRPPLTSVTDPLIDILVHTQDVARPLGRPAPPPAEPAITAPEAARGSRWYGGRERFAGVVAARMSAA